MKWLIFPMILLASCTTKAPDVSGAGFSMLHPSSETRKFIINRDIEFAREVAATNELCATLPGCKK